MQTVWVDADSCPRSVMLFLQEGARAASFQLRTVAAPGHFHDGSNHTVSSSESQATDLVIINSCKAGDIIVTGDFGLAALALGKGAKALSPRGMIYSAANIDRLLAERALLARMRRGGARTKGPSKHTRAADEQFRQSLLVLLRET